MAFERVEDGRGQAWMLDRDRMRGLFGGAAYSHAFKECARLIRSEDHWSQKIGLPKSWEESLGLSEGWEQKIGLPEDSAEVIWDHDKVARISARNKADYQKKFGHKFSSGGDVALDYLAQIRAEKVRNAYWRNAQFGSASAISKRNAEWAEAAISKARTVRDGSVMALGITASVATAGTATFFIGGAMASAGAAGAKYQDTGDARKAMMAGAFEVISLGSGTIIAARHAALAAKLGPKASKTVVKIGLTFASDLGTETAKGVFLEEKATDEALRQAAIQAFTGMGVDATEATALGAAVKEDVGKSLYKLRGLMVEAIVTDAGKDVTKSLAISGISATAKGAAGSGAEALEGALKRRGPGIGAAPGAAEGGAPQPDHSSAKRWVLANVMRPAA